LEERLDLADEIRSNRIHGKFNLSPDEIQNIKTRKSEITQRLNDITRPYTEQLEAFKLRTGYE